MALKHTCRRVSSASHCQSFNHCSIRITVSCGVPMVFIRKHTFIFLPMTFRSVSWPRPPRSLPRLAAVRQFLVSSNFGASSRTSPSDPFLALPGRPSTPTFPSRIRLRILSPNILTTCPAHCHLLARNTICTVLHCTSQHIVTSSVFNRAASFPTGSWP